MPKMKMQAPKETGAPVVGANLFDGLPPELLLPIFAAYSAHTEVRGEPFVDAERRLGVYPFLEHLVRVPRHMLHRVCRRFRALEAHLAQVLEGRDAFLAGCARRFESALFADAVWRNRCSAALLGGGQSVVVSLRRGATRGNRGSLYLRVELRDAQQTEEIQDEIRVKTWASTPVELPPWFWHQSSPRPEADTQVMRDWLQTQAFGRDVALFFALARQAHAAKRATESRVITIG